MEAGREDGFAEAAHRMMFPRLGAASHVQVGVVFQRAMIAEALLEAEAAGFTIDRGGIDADVDWIASQRSEDVGGGWRYFPGLPELPPDADVLAAVLRLAVLAGRPDLAALCDGPIALALAGRSVPPGAFETWIVDPADRSVRARAIRRAIDLRWGHGADVEVVANLVHALALHDPARFRDAIDDGARYVAGEQGPAGAWSATWYRGDCYATFACVRALAAAAPGSAALGRVPPMLAATQAADGRWGRPDGTPTDTALALLALGLVEGAAVRGGVGERGTAFLLAAQAPDGGWPASPFIEMDVDRVRTAAGAGEPRIMSHGSATLATALCLRALCVALRLGVPLGER